ncbi:hypothetical protein BDK51DRAFT_26177 [Blyttiomyces helicus]|uniref:Uncharacterized protein n=1 Tax=Blyttiomyces helicus TaxID=388810 RepID=A0A4P9WMY2_9FUNG|nr:hypothetical protein BDK51DRAFT_26177 [Blyttiomyces helicus]|eukprot:RKO92560.1 hypothetical protein BDK51DRAFT_26177 [Blyttiomyces helicus]
MDKAKKACEAVKRMLWNVDWNLNPVKRRVVFTVLVMDSGRFLVGMCDSIVEGYGAYCWGRNGGMKALSVAAYNVSMDGLDREVHWPFDELFFALIMVISSQPTPCCLLKSSRVKQWAGGAPGSGDEENCARLFFKPGDLEEIDVVAVRGGSLLVDVSKGIVPMNIFQFLISSRGKRRKVLSDALLGVDCPDSVDLTPKGQDGSLRDEIVIIWSRAHAEAAATVGADSEFASHLGLRAQLQRVENMAVNSTLKVLEVSCLNGLMRVGNEVCSVLLFGNGGVSFEREGGGFCSLGEVNAAKFGRKQIQARHESGQRSWKYGDYHYSKRGRQYGDSWCWGAGDGSL